MLIAVQNVQADLRAGFTAARDMSSHGNGYGDVAIRDAINQGRIDGPRYQVSTRGIVWGATPREPRGSGQSAGQHRGSLGRGSARGGARADRARRGLDQAVSQPAPTRSPPRARRNIEVTYPMPVLQALIDETHRLGKKAAATSTAARGKRTRSSPAATPSSTRFGLDQEQANMMVAKGLYYDPTLRPLHRAVHGRQRRQEHRRQVPHDSDFREGRQRWPPPPRA